jgi:DNA-binding SARP family transcriptional activator/predicted ATPase
LCIRSLGQFRVSLDGERVRRFETKKVQALLAYLAAEPGKPHQREFLSEMLWPDRPQGAARANLRHTLSALRRAIRDRSAPKKAGTDLAFLLATRETIQINQEADVWADTAAFLELLEGPTSADRLPIARLEEAVRLYRGPFLEDVSLPDSDLFHEWLLLERERYRRQAADALSRLAVCYEIQGMFGRALGHAQSQLELEPWDEGAHRQVMRLLGFSGHRAAALAQYDACRSLLAGELGVKPEAETTALFERIRDDRLETPAGMREPPLPFAAPGFLEEDTGEAAAPEQTVFVARERELARLGRFLDQTLRGEGRVVLVTGGPGQGKTALLGEFARRAPEADPDLLVARGHCSAYAGIGDPYLPFRHVLAMLTGDVEARWAAGAISRDDALRLWGALPAVVEALLSRGPSLIGTLLHGEALLSRAAAVLPHRVDWLERLQALATRVSDGSAEFEQSFLFEQLTNVLHALADRHPLVLVLDDLQWADKASVGLLFHLGRRLSGRRILIACAYRPEEVALGRSGERHPLEVALHELRRLFGDVWVDLDRVDEASGRGFVDAFVDSERNRLGDGFRAALFERTRGHPLFTIELLRTMQQRGDLVQDAGDGAWVAGSTLDWEMLPARVEAAIEQRVSRLDPELREIVSVASVEGEEFTAQVVARVRGMAEGPLLRRLTQELETQHRLVRELGEVRAGPRRMDRFRFGHILVQNHVYQRLGRGEQRILHGEVAAALEDLHREQQDEIAVRLAHHFHRAGDDRRAFRYYTLAAENAARAYASQETVEHYARALKVAEMVSPDAATLVGLHRGRGLAHERLGHFDLARSDHGAILRIARAAGQLRLEWRALIDLGKLWASRDYEQTRVHFERALELARRMDDPVALAASLNWMGNWNANMEDSPRAVACHEEALEIVEVLDDHRALTRTLDLLGLAYLLGGDHGAGLPHYDRVIALCRGMDDRPRLITGLVARSAMVSEMVLLASLPPAEPPDAVRDLEEAIGIIREIDSPVDEAWAHWALGLVHTVRGRFGPALGILQDGLRTALAIGHREYEVANRCALGMLYEQLFAPKRAQRQLENALALTEDLRSRLWITRVNGALAGAHLLTDDLTVARTCLERALSQETPMTGAGTRSCWARRAELALARGDPASALGIADALIASAPGMAPGRVITFLWKLKGEALGAMGHVDRAASLLLAAIEHAVVTEERFLLWQLQASLGQLCHTSGRQSEAEEAFSEARSSIQNLANTIPSGDLRDSFFQGALGRLGPHG